MTSRISQGIITAHILCCVVIGAVIVGIFVFQRMWRPFRSCRVDTTFFSGPDRSAATFRVGVAKRDITPDLAEFDPWMDADRNSRLERRKEMPLKIGMAMAPSILFG